MINQLQQFVATFGKVSMHW